MLTRLVLPALVATLLAAGPAGAQMARTEAPAAPKEGTAKTVPLSRTDIQLSFAPVVKRAAPSVVNVYASHVEKRSNGAPRAMEEFMRRFFGEPEGGRGPRGDRAQRSLGSGVLVDADGLVITNNHVHRQHERGADRALRPPEFEATIVMRDTRTDLAVLKLKEARRTWCRCRSAMPTPSRSATS